MGKLNEIQEQTTQSWGDNSFTTSIKVDTVEFDSLKDKFTFIDPVEVPGLKINGTEIATFDTEDKAKLDSLQTPMQVKGRVDDISDLPTEGVSVGDVYLVGLSGDENFEEYVCVELSGSPEAPVWENLGHVKVQSDWNQSNISAGGYIKNKPAIKAGQGNNSIIEGNIDNNVAGDYSHAEGFDTTASGIDSHAEGGYTTASGGSSHAEGNITTASGNFSHAEGRGTTASGNQSHAEGFSTSASGTNSHAEGLQTTASGSQSHAEGYGTTATHKSQHVFGECNIADPSLNSAFSRGTYIEIVGNGANVEVKSNARTLDWSGNEVLAGNLTIGGTITANGLQILPQKQADWNQTTSTESDYIKNKPAIKAGQGAKSIIEGNGTSASGDYSHAEGYATTASGFVSKAEGKYTTASGDSSHAEGSDTTASGHFSHAEGSFTTASGYCSHAEGNGITAKNRSQHAFGEFNILDPSDALSSARGNYVEIVGNGTNNTTRSNARTLDWDGNETLAGNLTIGGTITANGQQILPQVQADWNQTTSTETDYIKNKPAIKAGQGVSSIIEGDLTDNSSTGNYSHTEGAGATASGTTSHAEGAGTTASGTSSHAEGHQTTASHKCQHVFGEFNELDPSATSSEARGTYIEIVGNGSDENARLNARTLDWSGNETLAGSLTIGGALGATLKVESGALKVSFDGGTTWLTVSVS